MTAPRLAAIRRIALGFPGAREVTMQAWPWFNVGKRTFALYHADKARWIFKLPMAQQMMLFDTRPGTFEPMRSGGMVWSYVRVEDLNAAELRDLLTAAWATVAPKTLQAHPRQQRPQRRGAGQQGAQDMKLTAARVILFTRQIDKMTAFYRDVMGLTVVTDDPGWRELDAGGITIALHSGPPSPGGKGPKIAFKAKDVPKARDVLVKRGAKFGKVSDGTFQLCNGKDPDGNPIQLSNR